MCVGVGEGSMESKCVCRAWGWGGWGGSLGSKWVRVARKVRCVAGKVRCVAGKVRCVAGKVSGCVEGRG